MSTSKNLPSKMEPGFYVVRLPARGSGARLHVESRAFALHPELSRERVREAADNWRRFVAGEYPDDEVFIIEREPDEEEE